MMRFLMFLLTLCLSLPVLAATLTQAQEERARDLFKSLRCVVCQSQSIADSNAQLAEDMRHLIRERIAAGESDAAIRDYLVSRYGEEILMQPRLDSGTLALWFAPFLILAGALLFAFRHFRKQEST